MLQMTDIVISSFGKFGIVATHKPTSISAICDHEQSKRSNRNKALENLNYKVEIALDALEGIEELKTIIKYKPHTTVGELL